MKSTMDHKFGRDKLSGISMVPENCSVLYVLAHGAGAGMIHPGMEAIAESLYNNNIATFRFNFPYMEQGRRSPGSPRQAMDAIVDAVNYCKETFPDHTLFAGGKSYGGRMTSTAASEGLLPDVRGIIFYGFPLHAPGKPSDRRAEHLFSVKQPMLFLQGTRDKLAELDLLQPVVKKIGADIMVFEGADHSFNVLKSNPVGKEEILSKMAGRVGEWVGSR